MLYQHDVTVVDEHLAGKEDDGLQGFAKRVRDVKFVNSGCELRRGGKIGHGDGSGVGRNDSRDAETQRNGEERSAEADQSLDDKIGTEAVESVGALNVASPGSQGNVKSYADGEQDDQKRSG